MSVQAMAWVIEYAPQKGADLLCLIMIANHAHADGTGAFPSLDTLATECRMSRRQIVRIVGRLTEEGAIRVDPGGGRGHANGYALILEAPVNRDILSPNGDGNRDIAMSPFGEGNRDILSPNAAGKGDILSLNPAETVTSATINSDIAMSPEPSLTGNVETSVLRTPREPPIAYWEMQCAVYGVALTGRSPAKSLLRRAKDLGERGYSVADARGCLEYQRSETVERGGWRKKAPDLGTVAEGIDQWAMLGRPASATTRAERANGRRATDREPWWEQRDDLAWRAAHPYTAAVMDAAPGRAPPKRADPGTPMNRSAAERSRTSREERAP